MNPLPEDTEDAPRIWCPINDAETEFSLKGDLFSLFTLDKADLTLTTEFDKTIAYLYDALQLMGSTDVSHISVIAGALLCLLSRPSTALCMLSLLAFSTGYLICP
jgi:hypothetical protein